MFKWIRHSPILLAIMLGCQSASREQIISPLAGDITNSAAKPSLQQQIQSLADNQRPTVTRLPEVDGGPKPNFPVQQVSYDVLKDLSSRSPFYSVPGFGQDLGAGEADITLAELEEIALAKNPAIAEAAARVYAMQGNYVQVGLRPNPTVGYLAEDIGDDRTAGKQGGFVSQQFITGGKLDLNRQVAAWEVQRAEADWATLQQRVLTDVRMGYIEVLIAQERLATNEKLAAAGQQAIDAVQALLAIQEASGVDLLQAEVEFNTAQMRLENARINLLATWRRLAAVLGDSQMPLMQVAGDISAETPLIDPESSRARIVSESPLLAARNAEIERARWAINRARAQVIPNVTVQSTVQYDAVSDFTIAGVQVGFPLPIINRNQGGVQQSQGELIAAEQAARRTELALERQHVSVYQQYENARVQVERYTNNILPNVDEALRLTNEGYRAGEFSFLQLLTVQRTFFQTHLAYLDALGRMWGASRRIEGLLLSDSLESEQESP